MQRSLQSGNPPEYVYLGRINNLTSCCCAEPALTINPGEFISAGWVLVRFTVEYGRGIVTTIHRASDQTKTR
jgi:hypothetical protein